MADLCRYTDIAHVLGITAGITDTVHINGHMRTMTSRHPVVGVSDIAQICHYLRSCHQAGDKAGSTISKNCDRQQIENMELHECE